MPGVVENPREVALAGPGLELGRPWCSEVTGFKIIFDVSGLIPPDCSKLSQTVQKPTS